MAADQGGTPPPPAPVAPPPAVAAPKMPKQSSRDSAPSTSRQPSARDTSRNPAMQWKSNTATPRRAASARRASREKAAKDRAKHLRPAPGSSSLPMNSTITAPPFSHESYRVPDDPDAPRVVWPTSSEYPAFMSATVSTFVERAKKSTGNPRMTTPEGNPFMPPQPRPSQPRHSDERWPTNQSRFLRSSHSAPELPKWNDTPSRGRPHECRGLKLYKANEAWARDELLYHRRGGSASNYWSDLHGQFDVGMSSQLAPARVFNWELKRTDYLGRWNQKYVETNTQLGGLRESGGVAVDHYDGNPFT